VNTLERVESEGEQRQCKKQDAYSDNECFGVTLKGKDWLVDTKVLQNQKERGSYPNDLYRLSPQVTRQYVETHHNANLSSSTCPLGGLKISNGSLGAPSIEFTYFPTGRVGLHS
jgi:hypothetical protein